MLARHAEWLSVIEHKIRDTLWLNSWGVRSMDTGRKVVEVN